MTQLSQNTFLGQRVSIKKQKYLLICYSDCISTENPQFQARQRLIDIAREQAIDLNDQETLQRVGHNLARAVFTALELGFTPNDIRAVYREGAGMQRQSPIDPSLDPEYWLRVHDEAEQFWLRRLKGEE